MADDELVEIELGFDRTEALLIAAQCEDADLRVDLRLMDNSGQAPGLVALQAHRLLLRAEDQAEVQAIVDAARGPMEPRASMVRRRPVVWLVGAALATFIVLTLVSALADSLA